MMIDSDGVSLGDVGDDGCGFGSMTDYYPEASPYWTNHAITV